MTDPAPAASDRRCPACDATASACVPYLSANGSDLFRCAGCGTVFVSPPPSPSELTEIYHDSYHNASTGYFAKVDKKIRRSRQRVRRLRKYVPTGAFLDIGCNGGFLVHVAREHGFDAVGIDIDPVSIGYATKAYGDHFMSATAEEFARSGKTFDMIYCSEVIEHIPDVRSFLGAVFALLNRGGYLYLTTPDISHWRVPKDVTKWDAFGPPAHCVFFTPRSLRGALERAGFRIVRRALAFKPGIKYIARKP